MSYSDYTLDALRHVFGLKVRDQPLFDSIGSLEPSPWLAETLANGQDLAVTSEKARGEFIVAPVLMACRAILGRDLRIFSGRGSMSIPSAASRGSAISSWPAVSRRSCSRCRSWCCWRRRRMTLK